jgi:transcriptional regulator of acetoin/glycerol metabolism
MLDIEDVPDQLKTSTSQSPLSSTVTIGENEKAQILAVLKECGDNRSKAAQRLGISRRTIYRKLAEYAKEGIKA